MKKILATLLLGTALAVAALPVSAAGTDNAVTLTANGSTAAVHLNLPENEAKGVTAMQLSFEVDSSDSIDVEFAFDSAVSASVKEYTYNEQTGILNVYLAGRSELLSSDGSADLGEIQLNGDGGSDASVRFVPDSLRLVDASLGQTETTVTSNGEVNLTVTDTTVPTPAPDATPKPETTPAPDATPAPTQTPSGGSTSGSGSDQSSSSGSQGGSNDSREESAQSTATSDTVSSAVSGTSGQQSSGQSSSGSKKPSSVSTATPAPEATATPEKETQTTPAPTASTQSPAETATPEQSLSEEDSGFKLPVVPIAIAVCVVVAAIIGVAVIRFRG